MSAARSRWCLISSAWPRGPSLPGAVSPPGASLAVLVAAGAGVGVAVLPPAWARADPPSAKADRRGETQDRLSS